MIVDMRLRPPTKSWIEKPQFKKEVTYYPTRIGFPRPPSADQQSMSLLLQEMDKAGITWGVVMGRQSAEPLGVIPNDEIRDVNNLDVKTYVNDELVQNSNTKHLIFGIGAIVEYLSAAFTLEPGDVVFTGTPAGVGVARKPPRFMKTGDVVRVEISGLGVLENHVIDEP